MFADSLVLEEPNFFWGTMTFFVPVFFLGGLTAVCSFLVVLLVSLVKLFNFFVLVGIWTAFRAFAWRIIFFFPAFVVLTAVPDDLIFGRLLTFVGTPGIFRCAFVDFLPFLGADLSLEVPLKHILENRPRRYESTFLI